jgi:hypothetical protein
LAKIEAVTVVEGSRPHRNVHQMQARDS